MEKREFDVVVVGAGPNGMAAAITMQRSGKRVLLVESAATIGGGMRTAELTLPGYLHDVCSAIHPMAAASPFFHSVPLENLGLELVHPTLAAAHPLDNGDAGFLARSIDETAAALGVDAGFYRKKFGSVCEDFPDLVKNILGPLRIPTKPVSYASFGLNAILPSDVFAKRFQSEKARALWAGMCAHALQPLDNWFSSAIGMVLMAAGHQVGWPIPKGGSQSIARALLKYFEALGGSVQTGFHVSNMAQLPFAHAVMFDVTPKQLLTIAGHRFSSLYKWQLEKYRYGMGVFKIDWALEGGVPFTNENCRKAGTVHIGNSFEEIALSEKQTDAGKYVDKPFVLLAQPSVFDPTRAPAGKQSVWAYCHVPNGSTRNMTDEIERQVERFAPGFRERILARHTMDAREMEDYNPNYIGGDINGGVQDVRQLFTRPALRLSPYKTSAKGIYICSSSTPPGGGVHGMCGFHAAKRALRDVFGEKISY